MTRKTTNPPSPSASRHRGTALTAPLAMVDVIIFSALDDALAVLLVQRPSVAGEPCPGQWALPGGFIDVAVDADLVACAKRKLREKAGLRSPYLEQLGSWGSATRDPRAWSTTQVYFALVAAQEVTLAKGGNAADVAWFRVDDVLREPKLAFDHGAILLAGVERLRSKVEYTSLPAFLLTEPFTLPQLQHMYEVVLGRPVDKSGFRTRMLAAQFLEEVGPVEGDSKRPAMGYRLIDRQAAALFPRTFSPRDVD